MKEIIISIGLLLAMNPLCKGQDIYSVHDLRMLVLPLAEVRGLEKEQHIIFDSMGLLPRRGMVNEREELLKLGFARQERLPLQDDMTLGGVLDSFLNETHGIIGIRPESMTVKVINKNMILLRKCVALDLTDKAYELEAGDIILVQYIGEWN